MSRPAVEARHLFFDYGEETVLSDVTFEVPEGDFLAVIGPNGGGKSTLLKLLMGILAPRSGEVRLFGKPPDRSDTVIGYVPQETAHNLDFPVTAMDVALMGLLHRRGVSRRFDESQRQKALAALKRVGMDHLADRRIKELSGGERQRTLIARALASEPDILMLDEPTASIDFGGQREIFELLERLNETMTVIVVSHDMTMVMGYARHALYVHRTAVMHEVDAHTRYQIKRQLTGHDGHYCGADFWRDMSHAIECTEACRHA